MIQHEILVIGAGHNELTVAAYLARAGLDVGVLERRGFVGGGAQTQETTLPGFKHETDSVSHEMVQSNPLLLNDELGLISRYGLEYLYPEVMNSTQFPDGSHWERYRDVDRTCESIAATLSEREAENYRRFHDYAAEITRFLQGSLFSPPPKLGQMFGVMDSNPTGQTIMRAMLMSAWDIVNEWFEDDRMKVSMMKFANEPMMAPEVKGTGFNLFIMTPMTHVFGMGTPKGGGAQLPLALQASLEGDGGAVYLNSEVDRIAVSGGAATGVRLTTGEEALATRAVISGLHPKITFNRFLDGVDLIPEEMREKIRKLTPSSSSTITTNYALNEAPKYKCGGDADRAFVVELLPMMDGFRQHYDDCRYGIPPRQPVPYIACHDVVDPTKSPAGKANIQLYDPAPYRLADGGPEKWDEIKDEVEDHKLEWVRQFTTNMGPENILARHIKSPLDVERWNPNYVEGDIMSTGSDLYQYMGNRPIPELGNYHTPIENLFLCGPSSHPGGGVCAGGRAAAQVILEEFGIDFEKVVA